MVYRFSHNDTVLEFVKNQGRIYLPAADAKAALGAAHSLFNRTREEKVEALGEGQYLIQFKVALEYRLSLMRRVGRAVRNLRGREVYLSARLVDRYILAALCQETGQPEWLADGEIDLEREISDLQKAAVVAREVRNICDFVDWDIAIYNFLELNSKPGHHSRVVRKARISARSTL